MGRLRERLSRDLHSYSLRRALRAAVVVPIAFAIGSQLIGDAQVATFAAFGAFALLLFVEFPGNRAARLANYLVLGIVGAVLVVAGSLLAHPSWLAVTGMAVVAFVVLFAGVVSSVTAAAGRAALLTFILSVMLPGTPADIGHRLTGWGIALVLAVPVALLVWPPEDQDLLRVRTAAMCRALARMLRLEQAPEAGDPLVAMMRAVGDLRAAFRASAARPVALSTGSRLLIRVVDELEWLTTTVANACADAPETWPEQGRRLRTAAAAALEASAGVLDHDGSGPDRHGCRVLDSHIDDLDAARVAVSEEALAELRAAAQDSAGGPGVTRGEFDRPLYAAHELGYVVALTARTVAVIAAADSRSWLARLAGRRPTGAELGDSAGLELREAAAAERIAVGALDRHSVWLQNSVRGAAGLAAAVLVARVSGQQEGFWIVLGALSVLRSNALSTGATALRAVAGTAAGFVVGGLLVAAIGTSPAVLWPLLPIAILVAGFAPEAISFTVGQAAFTVTVIILFNIIAPVGWRLGVLRIEDVALGCAAGLAAGALFWPRGAGAALGTVIGEAYRAGAENLTQSVDYLTGRRAEAPDVHVAASASATRLDDAFRQYLAERGAKNVPLEAVTALANGASRLRQAGAAVTNLRTNGPAGGDANLAAPVDLLVAQTGLVSSWYHSLGDVLSRTAEALPDVTPAAPDDSFLDVVVPAVDKCGDIERAEQAERLLWSGQYVGGVNRLRGELVEPTARVREAWHRPWFER
jgi:uncharacterized membrane protein YccC